MVQLGLVDYIVFGLFILILLTLGFSARIRKNTMVNYLLAGRSLSLPLCLTSLVCTWYGGILGIGESVSYYGLGTWLLLGFPYYLFAFIYAVWLSKRVRESEHLSIPEKLGATYGLKVRRLSGVLIYLLAVPAAHILMIGTLIHLVTGIQNWIAMCIAGLFGAAMLYRGGLMADVRLSIVSFALMYIAFGIIVVEAMFKMPFNQMVNTSQASGMWTIGGGQSPIQILGFILLGAWTIVDPGFHQRVASASSPEIGKKTVLWAILFWFVFDALMITAGLYALALKVNPANKLEIFPMLANNVLPPGLKALFICGILGTTACAMVGYLLLSGSTLSRDIFGNNHSISIDNDESQKIASTRIGIVFSIVLAIGLAILVNSVVALWYSFGGIVVGALLIPVLDSYLSRTNKPMANVFISIIAAAGVSLSLWIWGTANGNPYVEVTLADGSKFGFGTLVPGLFVSIFVLGFGNMFQTLRREKVNKEEIE